MRRLSFVVFYIFCGVLIIGTPIAHAALINASAVFGQPDYITNTLISPPTADSLSLGSYTALDPVNHRLFVADQIANNRVVVYQLDSDNNFATTTAFYVFGQPDFAGHTASSGTQNGLNNPHGLAYDSVHQRLFIADQNNTRVTIYDARPATLLANGNGENAMYVLGQPDFAFHAGTTTRTGMRNPRGVAYDAANDRLFVSDGTNNRITVWDVSDATLSVTATGAGTAQNALYAIGQTDFISLVGQATRSGLNGPAGISYDSVNQRIFVSELLNHRISIFDVSPATLASVNPGFGQSENASYVIGQSDFITATSHLSQTGFTTPRGNGYDVVNNRLFVADSTNARVMVFDVSPATLASLQPGFGTAESAENVIGQTDYISNASGTSQNRFFQSINTGPRQMSYNSANNTLFVVDANNNRVLELAFIRITSSAPAAGTINTAYSASLTTTASQGTTQSFTLFSGSLPSGLVMDSSTGAISGVPTVAGTFPITVEADDNFSTGAFFDRATYNLVISPTIPTVTTAAASTVTTTTATLNGSITDTGGTNPTIRGFNYGTTTGYLSPQTVESGSFSTGAFTATLSGLSCGTTYHFQTYATNTGGTGTSTPDATFVTSACPVVVSGGGGGAILIAPTLTEKTPLLGTAYTFTSNESGTISYSGECTSATTFVGQGDTTIIFSKPPSDLYSACTLVLTDSANNKSNVLTIGGSGMSPTTPSTNTSFVFTKSLAFGMHDNDVKKLQKYLNLHGSVVSEMGPGSLGNETTFFGGATFKALTLFQNAHAAEILIPAGVIKGTGFFGMFTRAFVNAH